MMCWVNMNNEKNVTMGLKVYVEQVTRTRKTESN